MSSVDDHHHDEDEIPSTTYVPPPVKSIGELVAADQEDESLRKYKEALLGNAITESIVVGVYIYSFLPVDSFPLLIADLSI